jgi:hypothetical protein
MEIAKPEFSQEIPFSIPVQDDLSTTFLEEKVLVPQSNRIVQIGLIATGLILVLGLAIYNTCEKCRSTNQVKDPNTCSIKKEEHNQSDFYKIENLQKMCFPKNETSSIAPKFERPSPAPTAENPFVPAGMKRAPPAPEPKKPIIFVDQETPTPSFDGMPQLSNPIIPAHGSTQNAQPLPKKSFKITL